jgi:hypothetical protein|tara:strand:- start:461 stop:1081 length:621 start_codon:yes stop_codon:yes gene_type:complete
MHVLNTCVQTKNGQLLLWEYIQQQFEPIIVLMKKIAARQQNKLNGSSGEGSSSSSRRSKIKVFDDERENFFAERVLEIELLYQMFTGLVSKAGLRSDQQIGGIGRCGELLKTVGILLLQSDDEVMVYGNENQFCSTYGTLLYLDGMCCASEAAAAFMRAACPSGLPVPLDAPSAILRMVQRINSRVMLNHGEDRARDTKFLGIFRL